jgi:DNA polymerase-3 subunit beta
MKVNFNRAALQEALTLVTSIIPSRTPKPILRCLRITADSESVKICGTDLEVGITYRIAQIQVEKPGEVVVPADRFSAIIRESFDETICLEVTDSTCHIKGRDSHFTIYGNDASQFPAVPDFDGKAAIEVELQKLQTGIEQTLFATARESTRYAINGVLWEVQGKKLLLVATDGRRLARCKVDLLSAQDGALSDKRIIVPAKTMSLLDKVGGTDKDKVGVKYIDNQIIFQCANAVISSNLVEGNFPKYEDIIPHDYTNKISLATDSVLSAVKRAALLTNEDSKGIKLAITKKALTFSSRAPETGDAQIDMEIEYSGQPIEIGFNPAFLVDALRVVKTPEFDLELGQPDRPGLFRSGPNFLYVVMPINLG